MQKLSNLSPNPDIMGVLLSESIKITQVCQSETGSEYNTPDIFANINSKMAQSLLLIQE